MKTIELQDGLVALVDDQDFDELNQFKWRAGQYGERRYVVRGKGRTPTSRYRTIYMHRVLLDPPDALIVDHVNGDGLDNRRANLRLATPSLNSANHHQRRGRSGYHGVWWNEDCSRWQVVVSRGGKRTYIGLYDTAEDAARVRDEIVRRAFGEFATLNFPDAKPTVAVLNGIGA